MKKQRMIFFILFLFLSGCATAPTGSAIGSQGWYDVRMQEIEQAFLKGELTKEEQLNLKNETDNLRLIYQRDIDRQMDRQIRLNNSFYNQPLYRCNNGTCTPVYP